MTWFDDPPHWPQPILCHGHAVGWTEEADEDPGDPGSRNCEPRPALTEITTCYLCLEPLSGPVHMDHVLPRSKGGDDGLLMPVHARCNLLKNNRALIAASRPNRPRRRRRAAPKQGELWGPGESAPGLPSVRDGKPAA